MIHALKQHPEHFSDVISGKKLFEVRKNDRDYKVGDLLALNEYDPETKSYTGASCLVYVDYILDNPEYCKEGYVVMSIKPCVVHKRDTPFNSYLRCDDYTVSFVTERNGLDAKN